MRLAPLALLALAACGYGFTQRWVAKEGVVRAHAAPFENLSSEPGLGAAVTAALRAELARRGADAGEGEGARIEGEVSAGEPRPTALRAGAGAGVETWRVELRVRARLVRGGRAIDERDLRWEGDYLGGSDPLETEGHRTVALRRLAEEAAREILRAFEAPR